jgi:hypothetical protein
LSRAFVRAALLAALIAIVPVSAARAAAPVVSVAAPATAVTGDPVAFDGEATTDPDGDPLTYAWSIDGQQLDVENAWLSVSFAHPGTHVVTLTATDPSGASASASATIVLTGDDKLASSLKPLGSSVLPGVAAVPEVVLQAPRLRLQKHRLRVVVRCRGTARCRGILRIVALKGRRRTPFLLVQRAFDVQTGGPRVLHAKLGPRARARLGRHTVVRATLFRGSRVRVATTWATASYRVAVAR